MPFRFLNMFFRNDSSARAMKPGTVDQAGLESLQLLAGDNVIVNVDNHDDILSNKVASYLSESCDRRQDGRRLGNGVIEYRSDGFGRTPIIPLLHRYFTGGLNNKLKNAEVISTPPNSAKESP